MPSNETNFVMEEVTLQNTSVLCRICFNLGDYDIASYQVRIDDIKCDLKQIFTELSSLETWETENLPAKVCTQCMEDLGRCYVFLQKLRNADDKIKQMLTNDSVRSDDEMSEGAGYELIECFDKEMEEEQEEQEKQGTEFEEEIEEVAPPTDHSSVDSSEVVTRAPKRKNGNKNPHFVLTENVTNILSNAQKLSSEEADEQEEEPGVNAPPAKTIKPTEENSFLITKFVPAQPSTVHDTLDLSDDVLVDTRTVNQIRMLDMAAVEVKATGKIEFKDEDDESNIENPNTMYMCQYCPRAFSTSHHLIMHQRKSHVCQFCMKGFTKVSDLYKHSREAHNQFNCAICKKDFSSNSNLRQHMKKIHFVELPAHVSLLSFKKREAATTQE